MLASCGIRVNTGGLTATAAADVQLAWWRVSQHQQQSLQAELRGSTVQIVQPTATQELPAARHDRQKRILLYTHELPICKLTCREWHDFYRATLCISAVFAVAWCLSVRLSVTLVYCIHTSSCQAEKDGHSVDSSPEKEYEYACGAGRKRLSFTMVIERVLGVDPTLSRTNNAQCWNLKDLHMAIRPNRSNLRK